MCSVKRHTDISRLSWLCTVLEGSKLLVIHVGEGSRLTLWILLFNKSPTIWLFTPLFFENGCVSGNDRHYSILHRCRYNNSSRNATWRLPTKTRHANATITCTKMNTCTCTNIPCDCTFTRAITVHKRILWKYLHDYIISILLSTRWANERILKQAQSATS